MEVKIFWSETAQNQTQDIFDYYSFVATTKIANKIISKLVDRAEALRNNPKIGRKDDLPTHYPQVFKYIIEGNYKIIYFLEKKTIVISLVFDCRQNPEKIKEIRN